MCRSRSQSERVARRIAASREMQGEREDKRREERIERNGKERKGKERNERCDVL